MELVGKHCEGSIDPLIVDLSQKYDFSCFEATLSGFLDLKGGDFDVKLDIFDK